MNKNIIGGLICWLLLVCMAITFFVIEGFWNKQIIFILGLIFYCAGMAFVDMEKRESNETL